MSINKLENKIIGIVLYLIDGEDTPTEEALHQTVYDVVDMVQKRQKSTNQDVIDIDRLIKEVETLCNVVIILDNTRTYTITISGDVDEKLE